jgi:hypothetical protein
MKEKGNELRAAVRAVIFEGRTVWLRHDESHHPALFVGVGAGWGGGCQSGEEEADNRGAVHDCCRVRLIITSW